jgi:hypothetical protein
MLDWLQGLAPAQVARDRILTMAESHQSPEQQAALYFTLWEIDPNDNTARRKAAELYRQRYQRSGLYNDRQRYLQLTGELLPQRHEAPPLPSFLAPEPARDLLEMIETIPSLMD